MLGNRLTLFHLLGFKIQVDVSWVFIAVLVTWSLAKGYFPHLVEGLDVGIYWRMGVAGALGLFVSIVLHELAHSVVARRYGIQIKGITLFIFGGVAEMAEEPPSAVAEFRMAIAGPIMSAVLAGLFYLIADWGQGGVLPPPVLAVCQYLAMINGVLALFNLVPAFPLDGGRAFRAILWHWRGSLREATQVASRVGNLFGLFLIVVGGINIITGHFIAGMWWFLIGLFLRNAAGGAYYQLIAKRTFTGAPVGRYMTHHPVTVGPDITVATLVDDYIYRLHHDFYPVVRDNRPVGCITVADIKEVPREMWARRRVGDVMQACTADNTISPYADAGEALALMTRTNQSRLMVLEDGQLMGILTLKDMLDFLSLKMELEGEQ